jgi:superoxide dismutase, Fe-Mn family
MTFTLPELPYTKTAFGQYISEEGFNYHHGKHHAAYVNNLNNNIKGTDYENLQLDQIILRSFKESKPAIFNNAAQHYNHSFFWNCLSPNGGGAPTGKIADLITRDFGSFDKFKEEFSNKAATLFGSGWTWLVLNKDGKLEIVQTANAGTPMTNDQKALLTIDVWEHAYYIDHRNVRLNFIQGFWNVINWSFVNTNLNY